MRRKLTISIDEAIYKGLYLVVGEGKISQFIETLVKPHVLQSGLEEAYAAMAADRVREQEANEWIEGVVSDMNHAAR